MTLSPPPETAVPYSHSVSTVPAPPAETPVPAPQRLLSLDVLRGFDMFWIIGGGPFVRAFRAFGEVPLAPVLADQTEHVKWAGFHFYDLIFPLFVFISGVSLVFSTTRLIEKVGRSAASRKIIVRALMLFVLGVLANGGIAKGLDGVRWLGVLQRIAIAYLGAGLLFVWFKPRTLVATCIALLLGYWALLAWVPVPGIGSGIYEEGKNLTNYLDQMYLPGKKYDGNHDPEGLLSSLPAIASCLLGVFAGLWLRGTSTTARKAAVLVGAGLVLLSTGWIWNGSFPVIKKLWTSSFVLVAGGWSAILLGLFYYMIEVRGWRRGFTPFVWIGMNPITVYLMANLISFSLLAQRFVGGEIKDFLNTSIHAGVGDLLLALIASSFGIIITGFLYQRKIFLRV
ncbi:acyltransferase family protein [Verrucomicrobiota bacterium sgz303538]